MPHGWRCCLSLSLRRTGIPLLGWKSVERFLVCDTSIALFVRPDFFLILLHWMFLFLRGLRRECARGWVLCCIALALFTVKLVSASVAVLIYQVRSTIALMLISSF
ncbi:hypothetical protein BDV09DRAFT_2554 [Aspergillus tetrazonus]